MTYSEWRQFERRRAATFLLVALIAALLSGCTGKAAIHSAATVAATAADVAGAEPPAPAEATAIDEKALTLAAGAVRVAAKSSSALVRAGVITRGSPTAVMLARHLGEARDAILAANEARAALSATSYREALVRAEAAVDAIMAIIAPFGD